MGYLEEIYFIVGYPVEVGHFIDDYLVEIGHFTKDYLEKFVTFHS